MKKDTDNTITHMYLVPHFHYDVAWIHTEEEEEKRGARLVKQFCDKARSDPQFKFILDQVPLLQAFMRQYPEEVSYLRQLIDSGRCELSGGLYVQPDEKITPINGGITIANQALRITFDTHGNIISLIDKDNDKREIIGVGSYGNQLICQADNGDEYEYCLGQVLGTTGDYPSTIKMYKGPVMTRLIVESKFTESNHISREVKLYSKAGPDIEWPDACEKGTHTFEYSLYPHSGSWRKAFTYRLGWGLNNPLT